MLDLVLFYFLFLVRRRRWFGPRCAAVVFVCVTVMLACSVHHWASLALSAARAGRLLSRSVNVSPHRRTLHRILVQAVFEHIVQHRP